MDVSSHVSLKLPVSVLMSDVFGLIMLLLLTIVDV